MHNAAKLIPAEVAEWISSVVVFGDPGGYFPSYSPLPSYLNLRQNGETYLCNTDDGQALSNIDSSKVDTYCNVGDDICLDGPLITPFHLIYAEDASAAAAFIVAAAS